MIFYGAEGNRDDRKQIGILKHKPSLQRFNKLGFFNSSFLVFKAAYMEAEWILDWRMSFGTTGLKNPITGKVESTRKDKPAYINLPGCISAYESFESALKFTYRSEDSSMKLVLFVIFIQNQNKYPCLRMNRPYLSAYPFETEVIIQENTALFVQRVSETRLENLAKPLEWLNGKHVTIVYLYNMQ